MSKLTIHDFDGTGTLAVYLSDDEGATVAVSIRKPEEQGYYYGAVKDASGMPNFIYYLRFLEAESQDEAVQAGLLSLVGVESHTR